MEAIIFCGLQASGKTTYFKEHLFKTHVRISLDLFNTRRREDIFLQTCFETQQRFVIDDTNASRKVRQPYIARAKEFKFKVIGYYFHSTFGEVIMRNKNRTEKELIPIAGIGGTLKRFQLPEYDEGFDILYKVQIINDVFVVEEMTTEG